MQVLLRELAAGDVALTDVTVLNSAFDRMQQGFINFMMLGRALVHPDGFAADPAFHYDAGSGLESVINDTELYYYGNRLDGYGLPRVER